MVRFKPQVISRIAVVVRTCWVFPAVCRVSGAVPASRGSCPSGTEVLRHSFRSLWGRGASALVWASWVVPAACCSGSLGTEVLRHSSGLAGSSQQPAVPALVEPRCFSTRSGSSGTEVPRHSLVRLVGSSPGLQFNSHVCPGLSGHPNQLNFSKT